MRQRRSPNLPADLRSRLEIARLDTLALLRALDQAMIPLPRLPHAELQRLSQLDADCAEALWALDHPIGSVDVAAMVRDTLASLQHLPAARDVVRTRIPAPAHLAAQESSIRAELDPREAYNDVPDHFPQNR